MKTWLIGAALLLALGIVGMAISFVELHNDPKFVRPYGPVVRRQFQALGLTYWIVGALTYGGINVVGLLRREIQDSRGFGEMYPAFVAGIIAELVFAERVKRGKRGKRHLRGKLKGEPPTDSPAPGLGT